MSDQATKRQKVADCTEEETVVSVILPVYNAERWLDECLESVHNQDFLFKWEISIYNDCSSDSSKALIQKWTPPLNARGINVKYSEDLDGGPKGVGYAKNQAVKQSIGRMLCFLDSDDVMMPARVRMQYEACISSPGAIIGSKFTRKPDGSTERYSRWANTLTHAQLNIQSYTSHGPTVIMPTWFCARQVFDVIGGFDESGKGTPEDLIFFYKHLHLGGAVCRVDEELLMYRYHPDATTFSIKEETIWKLRVAEIQDRVISQWDRFTIWNAGRQGRQFFRSLKPENQDKVVAFCDVDEKKITTGFYTYEESKKRPKPKIPIVHFTKATGPYIICVKQDLTGGAFEQNLKLLNIDEGTDYHHFN